MDNLKRLARLKHVPFSGVSGVTSSTTPPICAKCLEEVAGFYCKSCPSLYCETCWEVHGRHAVFRTHKWAPVTGRDARSYGLCGLHQYQELNYICENCQCRRLCSLCVLQHDRSHVINSTMEQAEAKELFQQLHMAKEQLHRAIHACNERTGEMNKIRHKILDHYSEQDEALNKHVKDLWLALKRQQEEIAQGLHRQKTLAWKDLDKTQEELNAFKKTCESLLDQIQQDLVPVAKPGYAQLTTELGDTDLMTHIADLCQRVPSIEVHRSINLTTFQTSKCCLGTLEEFKMGIYILQGGSMPDFEELLRVPVRSMPGSVEDISIAPSTHSNGDPDQTSLPEVDVGEDFTILDAISVPMNDEEDGKSFVASVNKVNTPGVAKIQKGINEVVQFIIKKPTSQGQRSYTSQRSRTSSSEEGQ